MMLVKILENLKKGSEDRTNDSSSKPSSGKNTKVKHVEGNEEEYLS